MTAKTSPQRPAIILVHGFRGSPIGLEAIAKELRQAGYAVFLPPIPPFGGAEPLTTYSPKAYADYLANFVRENHLTQPVLVGHSMGSIVVAAALEYYPQLFHRKAVLLSPISVRTAKPFRLVAPLSALAPAKLIDYITTRYLFVPHNRTLFQQTLDLTHDCSSDQPPAKADVLAAAKFSTQYAIGDFRAPKQILLLAGEKDRLINKMQTTRLAAAIGAEVKFLPNTGHLHNYEQPIETAQAILDFLK